MAVNISIDLEDATFADLVAMVEAAKIAGIDPGERVDLDGATLQISVEPKRDTTAAAPTPEKRDLPQLGDAAIRSVVDILTGRQVP